MKQKSARRLLASVVGALYLMALMPEASAQSAADVQRGAVLGDPASDMAADLIVVRPLSLVGLALGSAIFVAGLPFSLPSGNVKDVARELVGRPLEYTFNRPLGDFSHCGKDLHPCGSR